VSDIEHCHDIGENGSEVTANLSEDLAYRLLTEQSGQCQCVPGVMLGVGSEAAQDGRDTGQSLQAPTISTPAAFTVVYHADVADLPGRRMLTFVERSVEDHPGPDASPEFDEKQIPVVGLVPAELGKRSHLGVVGD
jgi:hypothetical protein